MEEKKNLEVVANQIKSTIETITMYRVVFNGKRLYVNQKPFGVYSGLTGSLSAATFKGSMDAKRLDTWRDKMVDQLGRKGQEAYLQTMADFGTILHEVFLRIHEQGYLNWEEERELARAYFLKSAQENNIGVNEWVLESQIFDYCKSAASLLQFVHDEVEEIYAVEAMAKCDELQIATPIDIVCKTKKGVCALNIKTSAQIGHHQIEQVMMEKYLWNKTYDFKVEHTGVIRPKAWRLDKKPTYELKYFNEDVQPTIARLKLVKATPNSTYLNYKEKILQFDGKTKLGEAPKIVSQTLEEYFNITE